MPSEDTDRTYYLINLRSGGSYTQELFQKLKLEEGNSHFNIIVEQLDFSNFEEQVNKAKSFDRLIVGGGDGTVSALLGRLQGTSVAVGVIPLGTGNDLAKELGIFYELKAETSKEIISYFQSCKVREVTLFNLLFGEKFSSKVSFINYVSFGFDAKVVCDFAAFREYKFVKNLRSVWGNRLGYAAATVKNIFCKIAARVKISGDTYRDGYQVEAPRSILFPNVCSVAGLGKSNLSSSVFDEQIESIVVCNIFSYFSMFTHYRFPLFHPLHLGSSAWWEIDGIPSGTSIQIDGEGRGDIKSSKFRIEKAGKVKMLVGKSCQIAQKPPEN